MEVGDLIFYMNDGRVHSAALLSKLTVENAHEDFAHTPEQCEFFTRFGTTRTVYATCHGEFEKVYSTKEELLSAL